MSIGVDLETVNALKDAQAIIKERGNVLTLFTVKEDNVNRDIYNSIQKKIVIAENSFYAFPIMYNPTKRQLEKAGIKENVTVMITLAMLDFMEIPLLYKNIDSIRWEILLDENIYLIVDKNKINHFSNTFLNIVLGLTKK